MKTGFKYIYGPVPSWRLGSSLGIDLLSQRDKVCNFDCIYCQLGRTKKYSIERKKYVNSRDVVAELKRIPDVKIDYITFSGRGEPTLAVNLGETIEVVKSIRKEDIAVITNGSLINNAKTRSELLLADFVMVKLDAYSQESLMRVNRPFEGAVFNDILSGIIEFRKSYMGKLALQVMFVKDDEEMINECIYLLNLIKPDEVQVNTPLRQCRVKPLSRDTVLRIKKRIIFAAKGVNAVSVYDRKACREIESVSDVDTLKRRGKVK